MAVKDTNTCASCGASGDLHRHHLVPKSREGAALPAVMLCLNCHGAVHGRAFDPNHRELTRAGINAARARGVKLGPRGAGLAIISTAKTAARYAEMAAVQAQIAADRARGWADELARSAEQIEQEVRLAGEQVAIDLPRRQALARAAGQVRARQARAKARDIWPFVAAARKAGCKTLGELAAALMARGVKSPGGNSNWGPEQVRRLLLHVKRMGLE